MTPNSEGTDKPLYEQLADYATERDEMTEIFNERIIKATILDHFHIYCSHRQELESIFSLLRETIIFKDPESQEFIDLLETIRTRDVENVETEHESDTPTILQYDPELYYMLHVIEDWDKLATYLRDKNNQSEAKNILTQIFLLSKPTKYIDRHVLNKIAQYTTNPIIKEALALETPSVFKDINIYSRANPSMLSEILPQHINLMFESLVECLVPMKELEKIIALDF